MAKTRYEKLHSQLNKNIGMVNKPYRGDKQLKQNAFLNNQYQKIVQNEYYTKVAIETDRISAYVDFEQMEYYPIISTALNTISEEATTINEKGKVINIHSDDARVKSELNNLFDNILDFNVNSFYWFRNMIKNGDAFFLLYLQDGEGVVDLRQLNKHVERVEEIDDDTKEFTVRFRDVENNMVYEHFQIAHFRLFGSETRMPYGQSMLEKVRKPHKMLVLAEDAIMIKRLTRSTQRLVYKIDVGNLDDNDVESYIEAIASKYERDGVVNPNNGHTDFKFNVKDVTQDYFIPVRNGSSNTSIDTISNSDNLDQINDIEYLREQLFIGMEIPKQFIASEDGVGEGKSLAMLDSRLARKINRFQRAFIQELIKIAKIHLFMCGYEDDFDNFTLSMNNPSIQEEIIRLEHLTNKLSAYSQAITVNESTQIAPMSEFTAKKMILGMTEDEIMQDLRQQLFERAIGEEFRNRFNEIDASIVFEDLIKRFKKPEEAEGEAKEDTGGEGQDDNAQEDDKGNPFADDAGGGGGGNEAPAEGGGNPFEHRIIRNKNKPFSKVEILKEKLRKLKSNL